MLRCHIQLLIFLTNHQCFHTHHLTARLLCLKAHKGKNIYSIWITVVHEAHYVVYSWLFCLFYWNLNENSQWLQIRSVHVFVFSQWGGKITLCDSHLFVLSPITFPSLSALLLCHSAPFVQRGQVSRVDFLHKLILSRPGSKVQLWAIT